MQNRDTEENNINEKKKTEPEFQLNHERRELKSPPPPLSPRSSSTSVRPTNAVSERVSSNDIHRGYFMAARGYEFYLRVLKVSLTSERSERVRDNFSTRR